MKSSIVTRTSIFLVAIATVIAATAIWAWQAANDPVPEWIENNVARKTEHADKSTWDLDRIGLRRSACIARNLDPSTTKKTCSQFLRSHFSVFNTR